MTLSKNKLIPLSLLLACLTYLFSRIQNLTSLPVFGDEAIYIRWSQVIKNVETLRFIPLTDGKQPLFMWLTIPFFKLSSDPLFSARLVSVLSGLGITLLLFLASCLIFNYQSKDKNIKTFFTDSLSSNFPATLIAPTIYLLLPFSFFFDRLALADTLLSFFGLSALLLSFLLGKFHRLDLSFILGLVLGLAWITKSPAIYFIVLSLLTFLILNYKKPLTLIYPLVSVFMSFLIYNLLRLGPQFHMISLRNQDYVFSLSEILSHPLDPFIPHLSDIYAIFSHYISLPLIAFFYFLISALKNKKVSWVHLTLFLWFISPLLSNAVFAKTFTARYILYILPSFILLFSLLISRSALLIKHKHWRFVLALLFIPGFLWVIGISRSPFTQKLPPTDAGYLTDWTSGWGIKESASFLIDRSRQNNVIVGTEGAFGTLPNGLQIYTDGTNNLTVIGLGLGFDTIPSNLVDAKNHGDEVYMLINQSRLVLLPDEIAKLKTIHQYLKPDGDKLLLLQI